MTKRIIALTLCLLVCIPIFAGCSGGSIHPQAEDKGQQITMYLTEEIYNLDPVYAYTNASTRAISSLLFDTLFNVDENGKVTESLAKSYRVEETADKEYFMYIEIKENVCWSDNVPVTADDVVFAWKRILNPNNSFEAASLLFDIKNARAYNEAKVTKDDIGLFADDKLVTIQFEGKIDYDQFILNLTSLALAPLREDAAGRNADWAKKPGIMPTSGPFKLTKVGYTVNNEIIYEDINYSVKLTDKNNMIIKDHEGNDMYTDAKEVGKFKNQVVSSFILERSLYYYRNAKDGENLDVTVKPYRIIVDCSLSDEDVKDAYDKGHILYVGDIPMSLRKDYESAAKVQDDMSTMALYLNENAFIQKTGSQTGEQLFANKTVRQALSMTVNREAIKEALVFAKVATGLVPNGVFNSNKADKLFRNESKNNYKYLTYNKEEASRMLESAGINPADYTFSISAPLYDDVNLYVANEIAKAWAELGFNVTVNPVGTITNNDYHNDVKSIPSDLCDDLFTERYAEGNFEVAIIDLVAISPDPFSVLAPFATSFSGQAMDMSNPEEYKLSNHITGYCSDEYNALIEKIYAEKTTANRGAMLHEAEDILMEDMPVIPVVFNQSAALVNEEYLDMNSKILFWDKVQSYYGLTSFTSISVKEYEEYSKNLAEYISIKFDSWKTNPRSYFYAFNDMSFAQFAYESSNYLFLFKNKDYSFIPEKPTEAPTEEPTEETTEAKTEAQK